jgi:peptide/nickel transport system substrate-binding protein
MKNKLIWMGLCVVLVAAMLLSSCSSSTTTPTPTTTATQSTTPTATSTTAVVTTSTSNTVPVSTSASTTGNWWDGLGTPQYGGSITIRDSSDITNFDPYNQSQLPTVMGGWLEMFYNIDWTLNPVIFDYKLTIINPDYYTPHLATSWEFKDPSTFVVHLRQNIYWQNIAPMNGRQFVASDVAFHYARQYGLGYGYSTRDPYLSAPSTSAPNLTSVTATDKYTVVFTFSMPNPAQILQGIEGLGCTNCIEPPEVIQQYGNSNDWHHAIGTGPFILTDFVSASSVTLMRNPNYWGYDERYPQNQLPYVNTIKVLIIPTDATGLAAVRTGKIDISGAALTDAQAMRKTNPEILQITVPSGTANTIDPRVDLAPFNNIKVRIALQKAIDLPTLAATYYGGTVSPNPSSLTSMYQNGGGFPYNSWPQSLKDDYSFDPAASKQLLADAGYANLHTDVIVDSGGNTDLIQIIQSEFANVGVTLDIRIMDTASWTSYVMTNHKADALVMRGTGSLGQTQAPTSQLNRMRTGVSYNYLMISDPVIDTNYANAMVATDPNVILQILESENEYLAKQHYAISLLTTVGYSLCQPWLKGYNAQQQSTGNNAVNIGFYGARYWIDQRLKTSLGH